MGQRIREFRRSIGGEIRRLRLDAGLTQSRLAGAARIDQAHLSRVENGDAEPSMTALVALSAALGGEVRFRIHPGTGPRLRDALQARMLDAVLAIAHPRWRPSLEVPVNRPSRGVIDVVLDDIESPTIIAGEAESDLRRIEAQTRWANLKAESLPSSDLWPFVAAQGTRNVSRLLLLRSTARTRAIANEHQALLAAAYPARAADAYRALTTSGTPWPGAAVIWVRVHDGSAQILARPPRGVVVGR
jgi:transcriptional regulator with XRE-family HTH domain